MQPGAPAPLAQPPAPAAPPPATSRPALRPGAQAPTGGQPPLVNERLRRLDDLRGQRREIRQGNRTVIQEPGRTIVREGNRNFIRSNEVDRFRVGVGAQNVRTERRGRDTQTVIIRPGGEQIINVIGADGRLIRRSRRGPGGREVVIIDNRPRRPSSAGFFVRLPPPVIRIPRERYIYELDGGSPEIVYEVLMAPPVERLPRAYSLDEIRESSNVRDRMARVDLDTITFATGSWEITPDQVDRLAWIADAIKRAVEQNPNEVFLIEGHTDSVGTNVDNLSLSDRRAESVALALTDQFQVPAENLTTQGYGEEQLKVQTDGPERQNRRVTVRRITPLLTGENVQQ